ncbi:glycosyltransferase family 4 protein [Brevibacillus sp. B_LB10_24]|uniref:glycosyltransferase family 4 protein n=1 Tax=Brevibacillus sp. B_LB10_24 TaxID=3380645 RepID=UPI0038BCA745
MKLHKIVHFSSVHMPHDTRILLKECQTLAQAGNEVVFVVPHDRDEQVDKVRIRAVPKPANRLIRMTKTIWSVWRAAWQEQADVYHFHDPELIPVGCLLKLRGKLVVYDVHEDVPGQIMKKDWIPRWLRAAVAKGAAAAESIGACFFDGIIAATPAIAKRFPNRKTVVVQNFPIANELLDHRAQSYRQRQNAVAYVGVISLIRGVREVMEALALLPETSDVRLLLAGSFSPPELEAEFRQMPGWKRVDYVGWQSREGVKELLAKVRAGLVTFHPVPNSIHSQPNKLFEYMSAGIPVIASDFPLWQEIIGERACGLLVNPHDPKAIAEKIEQIIQFPEAAEGMGTRGWMAVCEKYNWDVEAEKLRGFYENLLFKGQKEMVHAR